MKSIIDGENFILPKQYPDFIPPAPKNMLSCVNFLLEEDDDCGFSTELPANENERFTASFSSSVSSSAPSYERYRNYLKKRKKNKFFKNVSFYRVAEMVVQQYMKSSYFQECDFAIEYGGYAYLFGNDFDTKVDKKEDFTNLITTQICYDVGYARKKEKSEEKDHPAPSIEWAYFW